MLADNKRLGTARQTRRMPYMARRMLMRPEISFAHIVHVSRGYRFAPERSSFTYGRKRLLVLASRVVEME